MFEKILNKSNSYRYYKRNYENSSKVIDGLKKEIQNNKKLINDQNAELVANEKLHDGFNEFLIERYNNPLIEPPYGSSDKKNFMVMELIADKLAHNAETIKEKPLISVIMPVYNREDLVQTSIDSVLAQTYPNFELIIVDDASTDGTRDVLEKINNEKVKVIYHEENKFCSGARNTGLKEAKGRYISYLDSDNLFDERYLAATVGAFLTLPDADAVYTGQYKFDTFGQNPSLIVFGAFNKSLLHNYNYIDINSFSHKREVYERIGGFDEDYNAVEDWDFMMRMVNNNFKIYSIPVLLSWYYFHAENRTSNFISNNYLKEISDNNEEFIIKPYPLNRKISIVIPVYQNDFNLENCIDAILSLKLDKVNVIISNNCSKIDLSDKFDSDLVTIFQSKGDEGFAHALNQGLEHVEPDSDIVILSQNAILTSNSLESLQHYAYDMSDCGLAVSQEILKDSELIKEHVPFSRPQYWCDISPSSIYNNISRVPVFHNGEIIELRFSPFFCTYVKESVLNESCGFNFKSNNNSSMKLFSEYVKNVMGLKIYHISESRVIDGSADNYELIDYDIENYEGLDYNWNF